MSTSRRRLLYNTVAVNVGCGCRKPKLSDIFRPKPKNRQQPTSKTELTRSSTSSWAAERFRFSGDSNEEDDTSSTFSPCVETSSCCYFSDSETDRRRTRRVGGFGRVGGESVAVEKDSDDPYLDFRQSMLQMILEKEIYAKDDLRELLNCFLQLNSPYHHEIIVRAFTEIWDSVFCVRSVSSPKFRVGDKPNHEEYPFVNVLDIVELSSP
ncbi:Ovate protein family, C-terminal [Dillenia turbinata]|uniref:Transcription repressor n=1 Tax=Dillenia turbinata TaxID=194707 RepID=A0AAN8W8Y1_9MAGN